MKCMNRLIIASVFLTAISACGDDDGDGDNAASGPLAIINSGNTAIVAGAAMEASLETVQLGELTDITDISLGVAGSISKPALMAAVANLSQATSGVAAMGNVPIPPVTAQCLVSGSVTVSGDLANLSTFTEGDVIVVDSDMCDNGDGTVVDGLLELSIASIEGNISSSEFQLGVGLVMTDFAVIENGVTTTAVGDIGTTIDTRTPPIVEGSVFGDSFVVSRMGTSESIRNFSTIYTEDTSTSPVAWTSNAMGTVDSSDFEGAVSYETPVTFEGLGADYPNAGELLITGADNASLRIIAIDNANVRIDADYDGDGVVDETLNMTWEMLEE